MRELFILVAHLLTTLTKLMRPGGARAVAAESLMLKHQMLILNRCRKRAPKLTPWDRLLLGLGACLLNPKRIREDRGGREDQHGAQMPSSPHEAEVSPSLFAPAGQSPWPQRAFQGTGCRSAGDQASQSPLRLSADRNRSPSRSGSRSTRTWSGASSPGTIAPSLASAALHG